MPWPPTVLPQAPFAASATCTTGAACTDSGTGCAAGRYSVAITGASGFACPLCRAGERCSRAHAVQVHTPEPRRFSNSFAYALTACCRALPAGAYSSACATSCTPVAAGKELPILGGTVSDASACAAGTYAEGMGASDCTPCPVNT
jgi:hypothetical protein